MTLGKMVNVNLNISWFEECPVSGFLEICETTSCYSEHYTTHTALCFLITRETKKLPEKQ